MTPKQALEAAIDACEMAKRICEKYDAEGKGVSECTDEGGKTVARAYQMLGWEIGFRGEALKSLLVEKYRPQREEALARIERIKEDHATFLRHAEERLAKLEKSGEADNVKLAE